MWERRSPPRVARRIMSHVNPAEHEQWPLMLLDDGPSDESGSWGFPPAPTAASSCSMQELLVEAQIPPELHHEFLHFTPAEFALVAVDLEDLNKFIDELVFPPDMSQTLLVARVRLLWRKCQKLDLPSSSETKPELPVKSTEAVLNGWSQVFPRKLAPQEVREMKQRFSQRYPSEPLSPENMPGPRLLSLVFKQVNEKCWKFIPWKIRLSEDQHDSRMAERPHRMPRLDLLAVDDVPQRDLSLQHMSRTVMQEILDLRATAIALVGGAHFHTLREMNRRFLAKAFERYGGDTGLRCPNHAALLMPRPNPPKLPASWALRKGGTKGPWQGERKGGQRGQECQGFRRASQWPPDCHLLQEGSGEASSVQ